MVSAVDIAREVERAARALSVWWLEFRDDGSVASLPDYGFDWALCRPRRAGDAWAGALKVPPHGSFVLARTSDPHVVVDAPTAALILLGHRRGLRVDIGECPACRGARFEYRHGFTYATDLDTYVYGGWNRVQVTAGDMLIWRPCPECTADGQPTGRHMLAWERAILGAGPVRKAGPGERGTWQRIGVDGHTEILVGEDPATRTALTILAHRLADPEHAAVFGDWLAEHRDPSAFPAPREGLAAVLHAWLAGPCRDCDGIGEVYLVAGDWIARPQIGTDDDIDGTGECPGCAGHGARISALAGEIVAMLREISQDAEQDAIEAAQ